MEGNGNGRITKEVNLAIVDGKFRISPAAGMDLIEVSCMLQIALQTVGDAIMKDSKVVIPISKNMPGMVS